MLVALNAVTRSPCPSGDQEYPDIFLQMIAAPALVTDTVTFTLCWRNNGSCIRSSENSEQLPQRSSCALKCCASSLSWSRRSHSLHPEPSHRQPPLAKSKFGTFSLQSVFEVRMVTKECSTVKHTMLTNSAVIRRSVSAAQSPQGRANNDTVS